MVVIVLVSTLRCSSPVLLQEVDENAGADKATAKSTKALSCHRQRHDRRMLCQVLPAMPLR